MSAVDVRIGEDWHYDLSDWQVVGDSFPLIAGDSTGGAGAMSFTVPETADARLLHGRPALLRDPDNGDTTGNLELGSGNGVNTTVTGVSKIAKLNVIRTAEAYSGSLRGAIIYYLGLCGIIDDFAVSTTLASRTVSYIGWEGNVLDRMKDLCVANGMTISLIGGTIAFRDAATLPGALISERSFADYTWQASEGQLAQNIEVAWYATQTPKEQLVYPAGGWHEEVPVFQVDAGETQEYEIDLTPDEDNEASFGMSATSIVQPLAVDSVLREFVGPGSVYCVSGKDGLIVPAAQWTAGGGSLTLELLEGGSRIKVTIVGSSEAEYAPFQIAMASGTSDSYSSLRIYGSGMLYQRSVLKMATGLDADRAPQEVAPIVDQPFLNTYEAAWRAASGLLSKHSSAWYTISGTIGAVEALQFSAQTFFDGEQLDQSPASHPYGNLEGSMFVADGLVFRIRSVTYTPSGATFTAEQHANSAALTLSHALAGNDVQTAADSNAYYPAGITAEQLSANPLQGASL